MSAGQSLLTPASSTVRLRARVPSPHDAEHAPHAPHVDTTHEQATPAEHACDSDNAGHADAWPLTCVRDLVCVPSPQEASQADHADHSDTSQVQAACEQERCSLSAGQLTPGVAVLRLRVCVPTPHDGLHDDHSLQVLTKHALAPGSVTWYANRKAPAVTPALPAVLVTMMW